MIEITDKSYTVNLVCPVQNSRVHIIAPSSVEARLLIATDLSRGLWFGHPTLPVVLSCRENRLNYGVR